MKTPTAKPELIGDYINGKLEDVDVDKKDRSGIIAFYYFDSEVIINDSKYKFWFTVRQLNNGKFIYSGNLDTKKTVLL